MKKTFQDFGVAKPVFGPQLIREFMEGVESQCCSVTAPRHHSSYEVLHGRMGINLKKIQRESLFSLLQNRVRL